ncbi:MAG: hypothetical protein K6U80_12030, partial [Firmicutes bacterium]|nr:hypothetical protein [Bacillota bacterium]
ANRLVRTRMLGGVRGRELAAPSYSIGGDFIKQMKGSDAPKRGGLGLKKRFPEPNALEQEIRADNRIVEDWLLWIIERKQSYFNYKKEITESLGTGNIAVEVKPKNKVSDPTATKGLKLSSAEIQRMKEWIELVEEVETRLSPKMQVFLKLRREHRFASGRNGWTASVQLKFADELARLTHQKPEDTWIQSRNTFTLWWSKIIDYTARLAAKRGLLTKDKER